MKEFNGKVAVITGAAGGIGYGLAERALEEGMKVVISDLNESQVKTSAERLKSEKGGEVAFTKCDVTKSSDIEALAKFAVEQFGGVHFLVNNAGVFAGGAAWDTSEKDWNWTMSVNATGVFNGVRIFAPIMMAQDTECHIMSTASAAGLVPHHPCVAYQASKAVVVTITENTHYALKARGSKVSVSVLCPGFVDTDIGVNNESRRPSNLSNTTGEGEIGQVELDLMDAILAGMDGLSITPKQMADQAFEAVKRGDVYINSPAMLTTIASRLRGIVEDFRPPDDPFGASLSTQNES